MFHRAFPTATLAMSIVACSDDGPTGIRPSSVPAAIVIQSGDAQTTTVGRAVADPLVVRVTDARGAAVRNADVSFEVVSGGGSILGRAGVRTDSAGVARALWRVGTSTAAEQVVRARVSGSKGAGDLEVTFHAPIVADAPQYVDFATTTGDPLEPAPSFTRSVVATVSDLYRNPVAGAVVRWSAPIAGTFDADETVTGPDGSTENQWTVRAISGSVLGVGVYWMTAETAGTYQTVSNVFSQRIGDARFAATSLAVGESHSCAVADAQVYCWGDNSLGQLGDAVRVSRPFAVRVSAGAQSFTQVVAGRAHTCALTTAGSASCWGTNGQGQLGDGTLALRSGMVVVEQRAPFVSLVAGGEHTCGLTDSGAAYCWGSNSHGQLGDGTVTTSAVPNKVISGVPFASLTAGVYHTCGLTADGRTFCWGSDDSGQIGTRALAGVCSSWCVTTPAVVDGSFVRLSAGTDYTCGVDREGATWCWGGNLQEHTKVASDEPFTEIVGGRSRDACGITGEGRAYCWTFSYDDDDYYYSDIPELSPPQLVGGGRTFSELHLGDWSVCGLERGAPAWVLCWNVGEQPNGRRAEPDNVLRAGQP